MQGLLNWLEKYSIKKRWIIISIVTLLISGLLYRGSVERTVDLWKQSRAQHELAEGGTQYDLLMRLRAQESRLRSELQKQRNQYISQSQLLDHAEEILLDSKCKIYEVPKFIRDESSNTVYDYSELVISGGYVDLITAIRKIESSSLGSRLVSARYELQQDWSSGKKSLLLHLIFKQISDEK